MADLSNSSWWANAGCMAGAFSSQRLVEPSMSVNRKVTVPVGGLATGTSMFSLLPLRRHYSSGAFPGPSIGPGAWRLFTTFAEHAHPARSNLYEIVTDGIRTRVLRSLNRQPPDARPCRRSQKPLIKADFFARGYPLLL